MWIKYFRHFMVFFPPFLCGFALLPLTHHLLLNSPQKMWHFPLFILLFLFPQFCHSCSPTLSQNPPTITTTTTSSPPSPCCSPLVLLHFFGHSHLHAEYIPPQNGSSKCHSNVQIKCSSPKIPTLLVKKIELAIFDDFGHFLAIGKGKINAKGICEKSNGKWKWKFGQNWANEIGCIWRKKNPKNGDKLSKWSSEENEDGNGKMAQKIAIFLMHEKNDAFK